MQARRPDGTMNVARPVFNVDLNTCSGVEASVVHSAVRGRVRLKHLGLCGNDRQALRVEIELRSRAFVRSARVNALTGSILIEYAEAISVALLVRIVDASVAGRPCPLTTSPDFHSLSAAASCSVQTEKTFHAAPAGQALSWLDSGPSGLSVDEAERRLALHGQNVIRRAEARSVLAILREQLMSLPILLLGASALLSIATGGLADAAVIAAVVLLNAGIATATEREAERTILGLSNYAPQPIPLIRDGMRGIFDPATIVPGDLVVLERGVLVPADARLLDSDELSINEAALTGEALPALKDAQTVVAEDTVIADRCNMVFRGTAVTGGSGLAVVTATGAATEIGLVQKLLGSVTPPETPIQRQLGDVGRELVLANGLICGAVFGLDLLRGRGMLPALRSAISLAVAAIPEGLPAVATTTLALGTQNMRRQNVLVRRLEAVETLGAVEVIGLDKTGTLTENRMSAAAVHAGNLALRIEEGRLAGEHDAGGEIHGVVRRLFEVAALCSDATARREGDATKIEGTPTECALLEGAISFGVDLIDLRLDARIIISAGRGDGRKRMSTLHERVDGRRLLCVKGDPAEVLARCASLCTAGGVSPMDDRVRADILTANEQMAGQALRVLGVAVDESGGDPRDERNLTWLGLVGLSNPIRPSVMPALRQLHRAGVRTVMITGDQSATAFAIARQLDLNNGSELRVLEAGQIAGLEPKVLEALAAQPQVFARVSPVDKLNIVKALQANGRVVAMTGDGVNDGPALRAANVGVAMGGAGTDVAREVADIVLTGDDLTGIVEAIRLGRATYANIRKVLRYLVSTNASETITMLGTALWGAAPPLSPMQLLWLNLVSDPLPALALGLEPPDDDILDQPPHDAHAPILSARDFRRLLREGTVMGGAALAGYFAMGGAGPRASTVAFHGLTVTQLLHAISSRSELRGIEAEFGRPANAKLYAAIGASVALQVAAQFIPGSRRLLGLAPLGLVDVMAIGAVALGATAVNSSISYIVNHDQNRSHQAGSETSVGH